MSIHKTIYTLEQRFAGVREPEQMGTSGLVAWVLVGGGKRGLNMAVRFRKATRIIKDRLGPVAAEAFRRQCIKEAHTAYYREQLETYR